MEFWDCSTDLGGVQLDRYGDASLTTSALNAGEHYSIVACYGGDNNYQSSTSQSVTEEVDQAMPTVTVTASGGIYNGGAFAATAAVAGVDATPAGSLEGVTPSLTYYAVSGAGGASTMAPTDVGTYTVVACFGG